MTGWIGSGTELLLQAARALQDTIYTKQVVSEPGLWSKVTSVASGVMTITVIILTAALVPAAWNFRKSYKKISDMLDKIYGDINPLMRHASAIADNVDYVSTAIRVDIQQVSQTVAAVNQRLQQAASAAEERINQLNALLEVVQEEAESAFVTTASTIRGVQTGINQAFDEEDWNDGDYDEDRADSGEKPRPRVRPRNGAGRGA
jgi:methyl-accepting chemotaxis protein